MVTTENEEQLTEPQLNECAFDNHLIAQRVATYKSAGDLKSSEVSALRQVAGKSGYSVIYITAPRPVGVLEDSARGELIEFDGDRDAVLAVLNRFPRKFEIRTVTDNDWGDIFQLYRHAFPTRFSSDSQIGAERARRHKLKCLRVYQKQHPHYFLVTLDADKRIIGFQGCMARADQFDLYESVILPQYRTGFAVTEMLRENLTRCRDRHPQLTRLVTRIYSDNIVSSNYYEKLGMIRTGSDYFYHLWIDQRRQPLAMDKDALRNRIALFLQERFLVDFGKNVDGGTDLFKNGFIDSFGFMELVSFLETEFKIEYQAEELLLGQLNSLDGLVDSVGAKLVTLPTSTPSPVTPLA